MNIIYTAKGEALAYSPPHIPGLSALAQSLYPHAFIVDKPAPPPPPPEPAPRQRAPRQRAPRQRGPRYRAPRPRKLDETITDTYGDARDVRCYTDVEQRGNYAVLDRTHAQPHALGAKRAPLVWSIHRIRKSRGYSWEHGPRNTLRGPHIRVPFASFPEHIRKHFLKALGHKDKAPK